MKINNIHQVVDLDTLKEAGQLFIEDKSCTVEELNDFFTKYKSNCRTLFFRNDRIEELPEAMRELTALEYVILDLPNLKKLPSFFQEAAYKELTIKCAELPGIPEKWSHTGEPVLLPQLIRFTLDIERMKHFPVSFCLPSVKYLKVFSNELREFPGTLAKMTMLQNLSVEAPLCQMPVLHTLRGLKYLYLKKTEIEDFSSTDYWPESLGYLFISNQIAVNKGPVFSILKNLWKIEWFNQKPSKANLAGISVCKSLEHLELKNVVLHEGLKGCEGLKYFKIKGGELASLPFYVTALEHLFSLEVIDTQLSQVPDDWSGMKGLECLDLENNQLKDAAFVYTLPNSKTHFINLKKNPISDPLFMLEGNKMLPVRIEALDSFTALGYKETLRFVSGLAKSKLSREEKEWFYTQFKEQTSFTVPPTWSVYRLLQALHIAYKPLQDVLTHRILELSEQQKAEEKFQAGTKVYLTGKFEQTKKELKEKLTALNVTLCNKWEEGISHIVVGKRPPVNLPEEAYEGVCVLLENQLYRLLEEADPKFLLQEARQGEQQMGEGVMQMLQSEDPGTQMVALEMLKSGGVPEPLSIELLVIQKCSEDSKVRKEAKKLLEAFGPAEWLSFVRDRKNFVNSQEKAEHQIYKKQCELEKVTGKEPLSQFSLGLFERYGKGIHYLFANLPLHNEWRLKAMEVLTRENENVLNLDHWSKWNIDVLPKFPSDYPHKAKITQLNLSNCGIEVLPREIREFENLTELNLYGNNLCELPEVVLSLKKLKVLNLYSSKIISLPASIAGLANLEELCLGVCSMEAFPKEVLALKNLKVLDLSINNISSLLAEIVELEKLEKLDLFANKLTEFPKEVLALKNLRVLTIGRNSINALPVEIRELEKLEELDLTRLELTQFPKEILALKNLKRLDLRWQNRSFPMPKDIQKALPECEILL
ncbi:hypothetical protein AAG747_11680 [Rapidithrix thailandica]|uniref:Disease resistance R13L4/SHOC-2-like LRR domain-containing protein n=1 Tax=Rapidithrix thailandica TaxID=413964 RepID=A0AAW9S035_9BACT